MSWFETFKSSLHTLTDYSVCPYLSSRSLSLCSPSGTQGCVCETGVCGGFELLYMCCSFSSTTAGFNTIAILSFLSLLFSSLDRFSFLFYFLSPSSLSPLFSFLPKFHLPSSLPSFLNSFFHRFLPSFLPSLITSFLFSFPCSFFHFLSCTSFHSSFFFFKTPLLFHVWSQTSSSIVIEQFIFVNQDSQQRRKGQEGKSVAAQEIYN